MFERPDIRYAVSDGLNIAYMRFGSGDQIAVHMPPWVSNLELYLEIVEMVRVYERAGRHHQVIALDKRGVGLSDRTNEPPTIRDRVHDTLAVMDAEQIERAHMIGFSESAAVAIALASRHPDRVDSIVLYGAGLPGVPGREILAFREPTDPPFSGLDRVYEVTDTWGTEQCPFVDYFAPSAAGSARVQQWAQRFERQSASPGAVRAHLDSALRGDVTTYFDGVRCPVFLGHCTGDQIVPVATTRFLHERYPDATVRLWDSGDHVFQFSPNWADIQADMIEFITGTRPGAEGRSRFAVVLVTDIVDSTAAALRGTDRWTQLVAAHDRAADRIIEEFGGRRVKGTGDGLLAVFTEPVLAVECARRLIDEFAALGLESRAGLHAGPIRDTDDGDIIGTTVNIACRIEPLAEPGHVSLSRTMADLLVGEGIEWESLGEHELKGIPDPVEVVTIA